MQEQQEMLQKLMGLGSQDFASEPRFSRRAALRRAH